MFTRYHINSAASKAIIVRAVQQIPLKIICESIDDWLRRLCECVGTNGAILNIFVFINTTFVFHYVKISRILIHYFLKNKSLKLYQNLKLYWVYIPQAYSDDLVIMIRGKYFSTVADLMQGSLKIVDNCYKSNDYPQTRRWQQVVLLTRKTEGFVRLWEGVKLNQSKEIKYLGDKLIWTAYLKVHVKKGLKALWSFNVFEEPYFKTQYL